MQRARGEEPRKPARNRGHLPSHLPRVERVIEPASTLWSPLERHWSEHQWRRGCGEMARIGEDVSERLDVIPAQFRVLVTRRPKYACRRCSQSVAQAHAPEHVVPGGLPTELFIAVRHRARTDGASMAHHRVEIRRLSPVLPPGRDLQAAGDRSRPRDTGQLG
jgi:transposase